MNEEAKSTQSDNQKPSHVVGIGASAGGLEALQTLFEAMPTNMGAAFVVIQHLSSDFKSMMAELLAKHTAMPVAQVQEGEELFANRVYLIPSGKLMRIVEGKIYLSDLPPDNRINLPINEFFRSLAEDQQNRGIGIILSGTGSDGSRGILALKEVGALVVTQDPTDAQFDGMPINAINTGAVDFVLKVDEIPEQLSKFISHPLSVSKKDLFRAHLAENSQILEDILSLVQTQTDLDFKAYKESTVSRRIEHRMNINGKGTLAEYWDYIQENSGEVDLIKQDLLIGVTQFFRDSEVWDTLRKEVVEKLVQDTPANETIRIWTTGCSTGEEAYTIAMLFSEVLDKAEKNVEFKVFASDVDQVAVSFAAAGIYSASISSEIPNSLLSRYFHHLGDGSFQVSKELRSKVVFATHNLIQDPPFSNMDLISCRNTLIYLQTPAQQKAFAFFHFALKLNGFMLLGSAESPGNFTSYFEVIDSRLRMYKKTRDLRIPVAAMSANSIRSKSYHPKSLPQFLSKTNMKPAINPSKTRNIGQQALIERYVPPTLIFSSKLQLLFSYGPTEQFTAKIQPGFATNDISRVLSPAVASHCVSAAHQVKREQKSVKFNDVLRTKNSDGEVVKWSVTAYELEEPGVPESLIALTFATHQEAVVGHDELVEYSADEQAEQRIIELDNALQESQSMYREVLEDLDTTSEELQSSNEELMAANEELQSTNEELQSVNEELYTVNSEHQQKIAELMSTNTDLENLLRATRLGVLFLDKDLNIRRFTHALKSYVNIIDFDINRSFRDLSFKYPFEGLYELIEEVSESGQEAAREYQLDGIPDVEVSVVPYESRSKTAGVVVSIRELLV